MLRTALLVLVVTLATLCLAASAHEVQVPAAIYDNAAGEWGVEVLSPCRSPAYGVARFQNTTAHIEWEEEGAPEMIVSGQAAESPMSLAALAEFMSRDAKEYAYTSCEHQENYLVTAQRPGAAASLSSTHLAMYTGILTTPSDAKSCAGDSPRNVVIHTLGVHPKASKEGPWRMQEALYMIEVIIETKELGGTCARTRTGEVAEAAMDGKRRSRKHRTGHGFSSVSAASLTDEALTESGTVTVRFVRRNATATSWAARFYTPILFASIVIVYRLVHSFVSTRTAKNGA